MSKPNEQNAQQPKYRPVYGDTLPRHKAKIWQSYRYMLTGVVFIALSLYTFSSEPVLMIFIMSLSAVLLVSGIFDYVEARIDRRNWNAMEQRTCIVTDRFFRGSGFVPASANSSSVAQLVDGQYPNLEGAAVEFYLEVKDTSTGQTRWVYVDQATFDAHPQNGLYRFPAKAEQKTAEGTEESDEPDETDDEQDSDATVELPAGETSK